MVIRYFALTIFPNKFLLLLNFLASQICDKYGLGLRIISTYPFWEKLCSFKNRIDTEVGFTNDSIVIYSLEL